MIIRKESGFMSKMKFKMFTKVDDPILSNENSLKKDAKIVGMPKQSFLISLIFTIVITLLMFFLYFLKQNNDIAFPSKINYILLGFLLGLFSILIHSLLHVVLMPKKTTVYMGFIPKKFTFYMKSNDTISKKRFLLVLVVPLLVSLIPLIIFLISNNEILCSIMWPVAMICLVMPASDYLNLYVVLTKIPKGALIQCTKDGFIYIQK